MMEHFVCHKKQGRITRGLARGYTAKHLAVHLSSTSPGAKSDAATVFTNCRSRRRASFPSTSNCFCAWAGIWSRMKLIVTIALGFVAGQILWELLLVAARWAGQASVRAVAFVLRKTFEGPQPQRAQRLEVQE